MKNALSIVVHGIALLGLTLLSVGTLAMATTGPAHAQSLGALTLNPGNGSVTDNPMTTGSTSAGCPAGFQGLARFSVRPAGSSANGSNLAGLLSGNLTGPFSVAANRSLQTALGSALANGSYELRVQCFDAFGIAAHPEVFSTTIVVSGTTWQGPAQATTTSLAVSPEASPQPVGADVTLTATVQPSSVAGTVEFFNNATASLGTAEATDGMASLTLPDLAAATYSFTAVFTPANPAAFTPSTSGARSYQIVDPEAEDTDTTLEVSPPSPQPEGTPVTLTAEVVPASAAGTVEFRNGSTMLGARPVTTGTASLSVSNLPVGTHSLRAAFIPTDTDAFNGSESAAVPYTITGQPVATETTLTVEPASPVPQGSEVTLTANVEPSEAAGSVEFRDGDTAVGTDTVEDGTAIFETIALAEGEHTLTAVFTPEDEDAFVGSTSAAVTYQVAAPEEDPDLTVTDADGDELEANPTLEPGQTVNVVARNFEAGETVEVTLDDAEFDTLTADGDGVLETEFTVPEDAEDGAHQLMFTGADQEVVFDFVVDADGIDPPGDDPPGDDNGKGGGLALTGLSLAAIAGSGLALTGGGTGLLLLTRRRRHPQRDAEAVEEAP